MRISSGVGGGGRRRGAEGGGGRAEATSPTQAPARAGWTGRGLRSLRVWSAGLEAASREAGPPRGHAERAPAAAPRAGGRRRRGAGGRLERREGRSTAAAFGRPGSGAAPRGWPRGGDMLTFRDNSWYQSGNSGVVRDRQRERPREEGERPGGPRCPFPSLPASPVWADRRVRPWGHTGRVAGGRQGGRRRGRAGGAGGYVSKAARGGRRVAPSRPRPCPLGTRRPLQGQGQRPSHRVGCGHSAWRACWGRGPPARSSRLKKVV